MFHILALGIKYLDFIISLAQRMYQNKEIEEA
jgi:hypothetical protein